MTDRRDDEDQGSSADSWGCALVLIVLILCYTTYQIMKLFYG